MKPPFWLWLLCLTPLLIGCGPLLSSQPPTPILLTPAVTIPATPTLLAGDEPIAAAASATAVATLTATNPPSFTLTPTSTPSPTLPPTPTPVPDTGWQPLRPGLEQRIILIFGESGRPQDRLYILRLEPTQFQFGIAYHPGQPQSISAWQAETDALIVVNGGFFTEDYVATGRIVVAGTGSGISYGDFAGMVAITDTGIELRWLAQRPYDETEPLQYALQSFPILVKPGGQLGFPDENNRRARRTVIAQDNNGRILFILTPGGTFTLHQLSRYLTDSDLDLDMALNLDGGPSTGFVLADPFTEIPTFAPIPAVITIFPRE